jgi:hypothetical protein
MKNTKLEKLESMFAEIMAVEFAPKQDAMSDEEFIKVLEQCEKDGSLPF